MRSPLIEAACAFQLSLDAAGRSGAENMAIDAALLDRANGEGLSFLRLYRFDPPCLDRKSTRLNSSHVRISYAVFCLKKKKLTYEASATRRNTCPPSADSLP